MKLKQVASVAVFTLGSRFLGLIRDVLTARYLGAGMVSDAFVVAFKMPNLFRRLFAEGSMQSGFIPIFSKEIAKNEQDAREFSYQIFTLLFLSLIVFVGFLEIFTPSLVNFISPGFKKKGTDIYELVVLLVRITLPYLIFVSLAALYSSVLNSLGKFAMAAFLPAFLNIGIIFLLILKGYFVSTAIAASIGISFGGFLQLIVVWYCCVKIGWNLKFVSVRNLKNNTKLFFKKIIPTILGAGVYQVNILIDVMAASLLPLGSISYLYYADRIYQLPLAIIGIAIGTVVLPFVSNNVTRSLSEIQEAKDKGILFALGFSIPSTIGIMVFSKEIISMIFLGGEFSLASAHATSLVLFIYTISLPFNVLTKVILPFFYANGDTKTPFISTMVCLGLNVILVFSLSYVFSYCGISFATVIASCVNFGILVYVLIKKWNFVITKFLKVEAMKLIFTNVLFLIILCGLYYIFFIQEFYLFHSKMITLIFVIFVAMFILVLLLKMFRSFVYKDIIGIVKIKEK